MGLLMSNSPLYGTVGKVGVFVPGRGKSGPRIRIRVVGRNPRTSAQTGVRANLAAAAAAFKGLSSGNGALWVAYASGLTFHDTVGVAYTPAAITVFTKLASKFLQITPGGTIPVTPPAASYSGDTITVVATGASGKITFTPSAANTSGSKTELLIQKLPSIHRTPKSNGYRTQKFTAFPGGTAVDVTGLTAGTYVAAYRFVLTATGQAVPLTIQAGLLTVT